MPPKKKEAKQSPGLSLDNDCSDSVMPSIQAFKDMLDSRLSVQEKKIEAQIRDLNDVVRKHHKKSQEEMQIIQNSQSFIGTKFDELLVAVNLLKEENNQLKAENVKLKSELNQMGSKITELENAQEDLELYSRRDCLEFHGVPEMPRENTDELVAEICKLISVDIQPQDISVSHRLPAKKGTIPSIIAKFTRRNIRDIVYHNKGYLRDYSSSNLSGSLQSASKLYINESLTLKARELFYKVREFRRKFDFKYAWTRNGKSYLKKTDTDTVISFKSMTEFELFCTNFTGSSLSS